MQASVTVMFILSIYLAPDLKKDILCFYLACFPRLLQWLTNRPALTYSWSSYINSL
ncbi:hypothetical protein BDF14DRAFT_1860495 [Spinellus fusiger]|nr:hypothetical protein BDF14DRAFT_1860495 [Spinellus fusiger]